jgi:hypothetical protein
MSRANHGLRTADTDIDLPHDAKFVRLWRLLRDEILMAHARVLHEDLRCASWREGERVTVEQAASVWLNPNPDVIAAMVKADLLDDEHRLPDHAWLSWYGPAVARLEAKKAAQSLGGLRARGARSREEALDLLRTVKPQ